MYQQISIAPIQYIIDIAKNMYWGTCGMLTYPCKGSVYMFVCVLRFYSYQCALIRIMSLSSSPPSPQPWPQPWPLPSPPLPPLPPPPPSSLSSSCLIMSCHVVVCSMTWHIVMCRDVSWWCRGVNHNHNHNHNHIVLHRMSNIDHHFMQISHDSYLILRL